MRTIVAVCTGLLAAAVLIIGADRLVAVATHSSVSDALSRPSELLALIWTAIALIAGVFIALKIQPTRDTLTGFVVAELFFGVGLISEFWGAPTWFNAIALLLVIPAALIGSRLAGMKGGWIQNPA